MAVWPVPWSVYALGVAVAVFGVWLQALVEMSSRQALTVGAEGSIRIHSLGCLLGTCVLIVGTLSR